MDAAASSSYAVLFQPDAKQLFQQLLAGLVRQGTLSRGIAVRKVGLESAAAAGSSESKIKTLSLCASLPSWDPTTPWCMSLTSRQGVATRDFEYITVNAPPLSEYRGLATEFQSVQRSSQRGSFGCPVLLHLPLQKLRRRLPRRPRRPHRGPALRRAHSLAAAPNKQYAAQKSTIPHKDHARVAKDLDTLCCRASTALLPFRDAPASTLLRPRPCTTSTTRLATSRKPCG